MQNIANITWWQGLMGLVFILIAVLIPVYKSQGIWPFNKKSEATYPPHDCPQGIRDSLQDIRDNTIKIETSVNNMNQSMGTFKDSMLVMTGQIKEMVNTIKEDL